MSTIQEVLLFASFASADVVEGYSNKEPCHIQVTRVETDVSPQRELLSLLPPQKLLRRAYLFAMIMPADSDGGQSLRKMTQDEDL